MNLYERCIDKRCRNFEILLDASTLNLQHFANIASILNYKLTSQNIMNIVCNENFDIMLKPRR